MASPFHAHSTHTAGGRSYSSAVVQDCPTPSPRLHSPTRAVRIGFATLVGHNEPLADGLTRTHAHPRGRPGVRAPLRRGRSLAPAPGDAGRAVRPRERSQPPRDRHRHCCRGVRPRRPQPGARDPGTVRARADAGFAGRSTGRACGGAKAWTRTPQVGSPSPWRLQSWDSPWRTARPCERRRTHRALAHGPTLVAGRSPAIASAAWGCVSRQAALDGWIRTSLHGSAARDRLAGPEDAGLDPGERAG